MVLFKDESLDAIECKSTWKKEKEKDEKSCQTKAYTIVHRGIQATKRREVECQTEDFLYVEEDIKVEYEDTAELLAHLKRVAPLMCEQLERNANSRAFQSMDDALHHGEDEFSKAFVLSNESTEDGSPNCISSLSWNCRGTIVAGAYGRFDHEDWCTHSSSVGLWRLLRRPTEVNTETYQQITKADIVIDSSSCVLCLEFHPKEPSLLAGGNFQGDLMIWDISRIDEQTGGDPLVSNSNIPWMRSDSNEDGDLSGHKEAITRVFWLPSQIRGASRYRILTLSLDGKLFIWTLNLRKGLLSLSQGYRITANDLPQSVRVKGKRDREVALTTAAISPDDPDTLLVGSDVGVIFKCTLTSMASDFDPNLPMSSPVVQTFSPHSGSVLEIAFSTHYRNMFVSCGTHGCIHFCNLLQAAPVKTLDPGLGYLYNLSLHPTRAGLIAVTTSSGDTLIFDLNINSSSPIHTLEGDKCPSFAAKFSGKSDQLAVGDANGTVKVWTLPSSLLSGGVSGDDEFTKLFESFVQ